MLKIQYSTSVILLVFYLNCFRVFGNIAPSLHSYIDTLSSDQNSPKKQKKSWIKRAILIKQSKNKYENRNYESAIKKGIKAVAMDTSYFKSNFQLGFIYFESPYEKTKAIPYLERALRHYTKRDTLGEVFYYQGETYQLNGQAGKSIAAYESYLRMLEKYGATYLYKKEQNELKSDLLKNIEMCKNAQAFMEKPVKKFDLDGITYKLQISLINDGINSSFDDYSNILSPDDSILFFTSRRKGSSGKKLDFWDDKYFEDIYFSNLSKNGWTPAKAMDKTINTKDHDASNSLSNDGKILYLYRGPDKGSFYKSEFVDSKWNKPIKLSHNSDTTINSKSWETSMNLNSTGDTIYVASDRDNDHGDRDLYWTTQNKDGTYGNLHNLGDAINTNFDEDAPFISANGKTLYFSSRGHNSMGGFDIFKSEKTGEGWSKPINLGYPINSTCDDVYYTLNHKGNLAYFSSSRVVNGRNDFNIYTIEPVCDTIHKATVDGYVFSNERLKNAAVTLTETESQQQFGPYPVENNGKYHLTLSTGKLYVLNFSAENYQPANGKIAIPSQCEAYGLSQRIEARQIKDTNTLAIYQQVLIKNTFFAAETKNKKNTASDEDNLKLFDYYLKNKSKTGIPEYNEINLIDTIKIEKADSARIFAISVPAPIEGPTTKITIAAETKTTVPTTDTTIAPTETETETTTISTDEVIPSSPAPTVLSLPSLQNVLFDFNSHVVKDEYFTELKELAAYLSKDRKTRVEIKGHTDTKGASDYNIKLSQKRATAVSNYLVREGVNKKYLSITYSGENEPVFPEVNSDGTDNLQGLMQNRRVEFKLIPLK